MRIDLDKKVYSSRQETDSYIYGSADVVGLMCLCVFCGDNKKLFEELKIPVMRLGSAFQKVNFLRDLQQDVNELGRVYFPGFSLEEFDEKVKKELVNNIQSGYNGLMCASVFGSNRFFVKFGAGYPELESTTFRLSSSNPALPYISLFLFFNLFT